MTKRDLLTLLEKVPDDAPLSFHHIRAALPERNWAVYEADRVAQEHGLLRGQWMLWLKEVEG